MGSFPAAREAGTKEANEQKLDNPTITCGVAGYHLQPDTGRIAGDQSSEN